MFLRVRCLRSGSGWPLLFFRTSPYYARLTPFFLLAVTDLSLTFFSSILFGHLQFILPRCISSLHLPRILDHGLCTQFLIPLHMNHGRFRKTLPSSLSFIQTSSRYFMLPSSSHGFFVRFHRLSSAASFASYRTFCIRLTLYIVLHWAQVFFASYVIPIFHLASVNVTYKQLNCPIYLYHYYSSSKVSSIVMYNTSHAVRSGW